MTDRPIIFSGPMVKALLDGRKSQTRRIIKKKPALDAIAVFGADFLMKPGCADLIPYADGDLLWVRECFTPNYFDDGSPAYKADRTKDVDDVCPRPKFKPAIHMPRWASRITLEVTGVKVERLKEISEADAIDEGATGRTNVTGFRLTETGWSMDWSRVGELSQFAGGIHARNDKKPLTESDVALPTARIAFANFINLLHGGPRWNLKEDAPLWDKNPFVAAISFKVHKCNIDRMGKS